MNRRVFILILSGFLSLQIMNSAKLYAQVSRTSFDFYYNNSTVTFKTDQYPVFSAGQPFVSLDYSILKSKTFHTIDINGIVRATYGLFSKNDQEDEADDHIHTVEFFRYFRYRGSISLLNIGIGKLGIAYNVLDWVKADADNGPKDEYRLGGLGFGLGASYYLIRRGAFYSHIALCYNAAFNPDAKEINGSSLADKYVTLEADFWFFLTKAIGFNAKIHYERHDFKQLTLKNVYPTAGGGTGTILTYRAGISLAI